MDELRPPLFLSNYGTVVSITFTPPMASCCAVAASTKKNPKGGDQKRKERYRDEADPPGGGREPSVAASSSWGAHHHPAATFVGMVELPLMQTLRLQRQLHHEATAGPEVHTSTADPSGSSLPPGSGGGPDTEAAAAGQQAEGGGGVASKWYPLRRRAGMQVWGGERVGEDQKGKMRDRPAGAARQCSYSLSLQVIRGELELALEWSVTKEGKLQQQVWTGRGFGE